MNEKSEQKNVKYESTNRSKKKTVESISNENKIDTTKPENNLEDVTGVDLPPHVDVKPDVELKINKKSAATGIVVNCFALRLREGANIKTKELAHIPVDTVINIHLDNSTESFYEVTYKYDDTVLTGFCLKEFIELN